MELVRPDCDGCDPVHGLMDLYVCNAHRETIRWDAMVADEEWARVLESFRLMGWDPPSRELSTLCFLPIF